jgi:hypothetical protein
MASQQKKYDGGRNRLRARKKEGKKTESRHNISRSKEYEGKKAWKHT